MAQRSASNSCGAPFIELQTIDSTNKYAMQLVHAGMAQHGMAIFAHEQTQGKGQWGKRWTAGPGLNIILSVIIEPERLKLADQFYLSAAVSLAVFSFFSKDAGDETKIKWPNDLYWRDRKAGGILIQSVLGSRGPSVSSQQSTRVNQSEMSESGTSLITDHTSWKWAVIGVGININQTLFPPELPNPVSLKQITGKDFSAVELAKQLHHCILEKINGLKSGEKENIIEEYNRHLYKRNEKVKLKKGNRVFEATIKGVSSAGKLLTLHSAEEEFDFGEIEWVI